jgi:hypothetical protein
MMIVGMLTRLISSQEGTELASGYLHYIQDKGLFLREQGAHEFVERKNLKFFVEVGLDRETFSDIRTSLDHVLVAANGGINRETKQKVNIPCVVAGVLEQLYVVVDSFRIVVRLGSTEEEDECLAL